jgi:lysine biosynthesis protein LysW
MQDAKCPMCGATVQVSEKKKMGDIVFCDQCDAELEIVSLKPIELDWPLDDYDAEAEGEDEEGWDLDDDDDLDFDDEDEEDDFDDFDYGDEDD